MLEISRVFNFTTLHLQNDIPRPEPFAACLTVLINSGYNNALVRGEAIAACCRPLLSIISKPRFLAMIDSTCPGGISEAFTVACLIEPFL